MSILRDRIEHIVVLMLENRGFDSVMGWLYTDEVDAPVHHVPPLKTGEPRFHGIIGNTATDLANPVVKSSGKQIASFIPRRGSGGAKVPGTDPHEDYVHVNAQLYGSLGNPPEGARAGMRGFAQDFASKWAEFRWESNLDKLAEIMSLYTPADLPILNGLAKFYAVSDQWFSSVPTQTNSNRAFAVAGTSMGRTDNGPGAVDSFKTDTLWNVLSSHGFTDWAVYYHQFFPPLLGSVPYTRLLFPFIEQKIPDAGSHFRIIDDFFLRATEGKLPRFSYIEPLWTFETTNIEVQEGNDYHPPVNVGASEQFLRRVYAALTQNRSAWERTLLIVTFDEHGGTYDHFPPPWGAAPPWGDAEPPFPLQHGFRFNRFGVRVPTLLISPYIAEKTVFRSKTAVPYDHTSVIATILEWAGVSRDRWGLGERVAQAPTFEDVLTLASPRKDNFLDPKPRPEIGDPLEYGATFTLRNQDGNSITTTNTGGVHNYPTIGMGAKVNLRFLGESGAIQDQAWGQIQTTEASLGKKNLLGAWARPHWVYYTDDQRNTSQTWQIQKVNRSIEAVRYGDEVKFYQKDWPSKPILSRTASRDGYLTSLPPSEGDTWTIEPPEPTLREPQFSGEPHPST